MICDQRFLVGMTQGARKRAARRWYAALDGMHVGDFSRRLAWYTEHKLARGLRQERDAAWGRAKRQEGSGPGDAYCDGSGVLPAKVKSQDGESWVR